jgi:hypothetical protein
VPPIACRLSVASKILHTCKLCVTDSALKTTLVCNSDVKVDMVLDKGFIVGFKVNTVVTVNCMQSFGLQHQLATCFCLFFASLTLMP